MALLRRIRQPYRHLGDLCLSLPNPVDIPLHRLLQRLAHPAHSLLSRPKNDRMLLHHRWNFHPPDGRLIGRARLKAVGRWVIYAKNPVNRW